MKHADRDQGRRHQPGRAPSGPGPGAGRRRGTDAEGLRDEEVDAEDGQPAQEGFFTAGAVSTVVAAAPAPSSGLYPFTTFWG